MSATSGSTVSVVLNRERLNGVTAPATFETTGSFAVRLSNEGEPVHVHVRPEGQLAEVASVTESNRYVDRDGDARVQVNVAQVSDPVSGELALVTGHGTESHRVDVTVTPPDAESTPDRTADATTARSDATDGGDARGTRKSGNAPDTTGETDAGREPDGSIRAATVSGTPGLLADPAGLLTVLLVVGALVLAIAVQITYRSLVVTTGVLAVVVAAAAAVWILLRD